MTLTPHELLDRLSAILPGFAERWSDSGNLFIGPGGAFTLCGAFSECSDFVRESYRTLTDNQKKLLAEVIEWCMSYDLGDSDALLPTAAATCFLENLTYEAFSSDWEGFLGNESKKFVHGWYGQ